MVEKSVWTLFFISILACCLVVFEEEPAAVIPHMERTYRLSNGRFATMEYVEKNCIVDSSDGFVCRIDTNGWGTRIQAENNLLRMKVEEGFRRKAEEKENAVAALKLLRKLSE